MTKMVSLDTATTITGFAVFENGKLKRSGVIDFSKEKDALIRIENMILAIYNILEEEKADIVVTELTVVPRNANSQRILSELLGAVWGWTLLNVAEYVEYRPSEWRHLIADIDEKIPVKRDDAKVWSLDKAIGMGFCPDDDNESDAILLGVARINQLAGN